MKKIAVFAHFDIHNKIENYVLHYLKSLVDCGAKIVFVSDSNLSNEELEKIKDFTVKIIAKHHGEYDFGSYKIGFEYCLNSGILDDFDELIFANDSCYAPLAPFEKMFETMDKKDVDFWGITANKTKSTNFILHIQSFFYAFRKSVFCSEYFKNLVHSFSKLSFKEDIIFEYECGVTKKLEDCGFKWDVYCPSSLSHSDAYIYDYKKLIKQGCPLLKRSIPLKRARMPIFGLYNFIKSTGYNLSYIQEDISENKKVLSFKDNLVILYKLLLKIPYIKVKYSLCDLLHK